MSKIKGFETNLGRKDSSENVLFMILKTVNVRRQNYLGVIRLFRGAINFKYKSKSNKHQQKKKNITTGKKEKQMRERDGRAARHMPAMGWDGMLDPVIFSCCSRHHQRRQQRQRQIFF